MHNAIQHQLLILVNVKMVILEVDFHVFQQTVQQELFNLVKLVSVINVPIVNHDSHAAMKMQVHHQQHASARKDGLEMENSACQRKMLHEVISKPLLNHQQLDLEHKQLHFTLNNMRKCCTII